MFVHFPAALLPVSLLLLLLALWRKTDGLFVATKCCVYLAAVGALAAAWTGWNASESIAHGEALHGMMQTHKYAALIVLAVAALAAGWCWLRPIQPGTSGWVLAALLVVANLLVVAVGDLGARMVYRHGAAVERVAEPAEQGEHRHEHD